MDGRLSDTDSRLEESMTSFVENKELVAMTIIIEHIMQVYNRNFSEYADKGG